jgi:hypothetical protein
VTFAAFGSAWVPGALRAWGWAPRADFSARFALLHAGAQRGLPAAWMQASVLLAVIATGALLRRGPWGPRALALLLRLWFLRALLGWWLPWRTGEAHLVAFDTTLEPSPLGAPAPLGWFAWIWLVAVWAPRERGGAWGALVAVLAGAWAWWACGLADLGGCLIAAAAAVPLWIGYRAAPE